LQLCQHSLSCSGCTLWDLSREQEIQVKLERVKTQIQPLTKHATPDLTYSDLGPYGLRDRVDMIWQDGFLGFYHKDLDPQGKKLVEKIFTCLQMSAELQSFFSEAQEFLRCLPGLRGSLRLRVSPQGLRGIWFDFANVDIRKLLDCKDLLTAAAQNKVILEFGQRAKRSVFRKDDTYGLGEAQLEVWANTIHKGQTVPLYLPIMGFSQTGRISAQKMCELVLSRLRSRFVERIWEFGSGSGLFTFPLAEISEQVIACEHSVMAVEGLHKSIAQAGLQKQITVYQDDFQRKPLPRFADARSTGVFLNPPRSGVGEFLNHSLTQQNQDLRPQWIAYMSCFPESMVKDCSLLPELGYRLHSVDCIDQFPRTSHIECLALWIL
jgi:23S rRNA (uracil1939-C5)-methyltransferase